MRGLGDIMQWKSSLAVIGLMGLMSLQVTSQIQFKALVITHVTVVDVRDGRTRPDMTVVIRVIASSRWARQDALTFRKTRKS